MAFRRYAIAAIAALCMSSANAQPAAGGDWVQFSRFLSLVQVLMQAAAACPQGTAAGDCDPSAAQKAFDDILNGKNPEANALMLEILADVPPADREKLLSVGRSMAAMAKKQVAMQAPGSSDAVAIRARKDLAGMGLAYYNAGQFLDAVKRNDALAVRLFLAGRGVDPNAKDVWGNSAFDLAKRGGNPEIIALLAGAAGRAQQSP